MPWAKEALLHHDDGILIELSHLEAAKRKEFLDNLAAGFEKDKFNLIETIDILKKNTNEDEMLFSKEFRDLWLLMEIKLLGKS